MELCVCTSVHIYCYIGMYAHLKTFSQQHSLFEVGMFSIHGK